MAKLNLTNKNLLSQDQELIDDLKSNGFLLDYKGYYSKRIKSVGIEVLLNCDIILSNISAPGRDETWNQYKKIECNSTQELAQELSKIINSLT